jgi:hypothetical protein
MNPYEPPEENEPPRRSVSRTWQPVLGVFFMILGAAIIGLGHVPVSAVVVLAFFLIAIVIGAVANSRGNRR